MNSSNARRRPGLTLVELLVVLTILAVMTTLAVTMTDSFVDQGRYEATQRTMESVRDAICGDPNLRNEDGTPRTSGFVADNGRLPLNLSELYQQPATWFSGFMPAGSDAGVQVFFPGWRGSYIRLPVQTTPQIVDGWGNPFTYDTATPKLEFKRNDPTSKNQYDNLAPAPLLLPVSAPVSVSVKLNFPSTGAPTSITNTDRIIVRMYSAFVNASHVPSVNEILLKDPLTSNAFHAIDTSAGNTMYGFAETNVTIGPKYLRAYVVDATGAAKSPPLASQIVRFHLPVVGRLNLPTLYIETP